MVVVYSNHNSYACRPYSKTEGAFRRQLVIKLVMLIICCSGDKNLEIQFEGSGLTFDLLRCN